MNQIKALYDYLNLGLNLARNTPGVQSSSGWKQILRIDSDSDLELEKMMLQLKSTTLELYDSLKTEYLIDHGNLVGFRNDWIFTVLKTLDLQGSLGQNFNNFNDNTLALVYAHIKGWNHGYSVKSKMDEEKVLELISKLENEKQKILDDQTITDDLKRVLIIQIEKLIFALRNFETLGNDQVKSAVTEFYANAFFNNDVTEYYKGHPSFKEVIDAISASITIATFSTPLIQSAFVKAISLVS